MQHGSSHGGRPPLTSTYRLQMNAGFTFAQARAQVPYFARLGVSHLYCSPILAARRGSMHGYDVVDPTRLNPELGTEEELRALARELRAHEMGLVVDIVPNHMGIGAENRYWDDVLTHGERSRYARWFDIDWTASSERGRQVVLPILADDLDRVLERGEIWNARSGFGEGEARVHLHAIGARERRRCAARRLGLHAPSQSRVVPRAARRRPSQRSAACTSSLAMITSIG